MDKPIPEAVRELLDEMDNAAAADLANEPGSPAMRDALHEYAARIRAALTAAQQQRQATACECPIPLDDPPNMHAPGCVVRQPMQQWQAVEYQSQVSDKDTGEVVYPWARCQKAAYDAVSGQPHEGSKLRVEYRALYTAPPSAPVGVEAALAKLREVLGADGTVYRDVQAMLLAQQPAVTVKTQEQWGIECCNNPDCHHD